MTLAITFFFRFRTIWQYSSSIPSFILVPLLCPRRKPRYGLLSSGCPSRHAVCRQQISTGCRGSRSFFCVSRTRSNDCYTSQRSFSLLRLQLSSRLSHLLEHVKTSEAVRATVEANKIHKTASRDQTDDNGKYIFRIFIVSRFGFGSFQRRFMYLAGT